MNEDPNEASRRTLLRWLAIALSGGAVASLTRRGDCARQVQCNGCPLLQNCELPFAQEKKNAER
jgi:hypothetical protein